MPRHIMCTSSLFNPVVRGHGNKWHWKLRSGEPPSLQLKVTVVNYSEKEMTGRTKVLTQTGHPPDEINVYSLCLRSFFWCKRKKGLNLVVPLIYFWCGAIHIDVPLSGSVCGGQAGLYQSCTLYSARMLSDACHITSPPAETETHWALRIFISIKVIVRVNQAPVHNLSFFDELA